MLKLYTCTQVLTWRQVISMSKTGVDRLVYEDRIKIKATNSRHINK